MNYLALLKWIKNKSVRIVGYWAITAYAEITSDDNQQLFIDLKAAGFDAELASNVVIVFF